MSMSSASRILGRWHLVHRRERVFGVRSLATSAQKRKWTKHGSNDNMRKSQRGQRHDPILEETVKSKAEEIREKGVNWRPILFLGVFPIVMSGLVVLSREDLRQEVEEKGLGRALQDFRHWRTRKGREHERRRQEEEEIAKEKLKQLENPLA